MGPLPFTGVSQAAQLMDHLTNLLWAASWEEGKGEGSQGEVYGFQRSSVQLAFSFDNFAFVVNMNNTGKATFYVQLYIISYFIKFSLDQNLQFLSDIIIIVIIRIDTVGGFAVGLSPVWGLRFPVWGAKR